MLLLDLLIALPGLLSPAITSTPAKDTNLTRSETPVVTASRSTTSSIRDTGGTIRFTTDPGITKDDATVRNEYLDARAEPDDPVPSPEVPPPGDDDLPGGTAPGGGGESPGEIPVPDPSLPRLSDELTAEAGRVLNFAIPEDGTVSEIRILSQGQHGHISVNPDNSLSLVLSEEPGRIDPITFAYQITHIDGQTETVNATIEVTEGQQKAGWSLGDLYMLEEGSDGKVIVEHGENHRKVHITEGQHGWTAAKIARAEKIAADKITAKWLIEHPEYGATSDKALDSKLGMALWSEITSMKTGPASHWLLLERGYQYDDVDRLIYRGASGESAINPLYVGAYGTGKDPVIGGSIRIFQNQSEHIVIQDIATKAGVMALLGENILFDNMTLSGDGFNLQNVTRLTLRNSQIIDVVDPKASGSTWQGSLDRVSGAYISKSSGVLVEDNFFDHNGWGDGYAHNLSSQKPQAPSMYSHNLYMQHDNLDVTLRDNILMRGASFGAQVRSGGMIENNVFIDNNAALNFLGGNYNGAGYVGQYTLLLDNLITSAGHKTVAKHQGALSMGVVTGGQQSSLIENIIAHLADPNNPAEKARKDIIHEALTAGKTHHYDDTIVYNWGADGKPWANNPNRGINGADTAVLDQTTIQNFTAQLLGKKTATIADLANHLRAQAAGKLDHVVDADLINAFFRKGFGLDTELRATETTLRFIPDDRGEGMRWDNRLNWSTGDLPGTQDGDSVDLGGNRVLFGSKTVSVDDFIFGNSGQLKASSGRLNIDGDMSVTGKANLLEITNAGQIWVDGYRDSDLLRIDAQGGRFANSGAFAGGVKMTVSGDAQALLATGGGSFDLAKGSSLTVTGTRAKAGFDGDHGDTAVLRLHDGAQLNFTATADGFGKIREFHSGAFETGNVTSGVRLDGDLSIDLRDWKADPKAASWTLIDADQIIGSFDSLSVKGLDSDRDLLVRIDYVKDQVILKIGADGAGSGQTRISSTGAADFINYTQDADLKQLWADLNADLPQISDSPL